MTAFFYRTSAGAEIDLLLVWPDGRLWAVDSKRSLDPRPERGFHAACAVEPERRFVIYPGDDTYAIKADTIALPLAALAGILMEAAAAR